MKQLITLILILFTSSIGLSQNENEPGFTTKIDFATQLGDFAVDTPKEKLLEYLIMDTEVLGDDFLTSSYQVDFKKVGLTNYFGLAITEMWVEFDGELDATGKPISEDIYTVGVRLELPKSDKELSSFMIQLEDFFGEAERMFDPSYTNLVRLFWWSEITMLTVNLGVDVETGGDLEYFEVRFNQAYGG